MSIMFMKLNEQLKVTKRYNNFIANVSHELKSPLASIQLYLETLKARDVPRPKQEEFIELMIKDARRLGTLINSILEISGLEDKKKVFHHALHQAESLVYTLVEEAVEQFQLPAGAVEIRGKAPCTCKADRSALKVVLNNLFDNAMKYSVEPVHLTITLSCTAKRFTIEVTDRGIGIPEKEKKEVFQKFRRLYNPDSPNVKGTGLGLYWVKEIVGQHKGRVNVVSAGRDKGTTFKIELPVYRKVKNG
jgi:signal transduction histidine kinase